MPVKKIFQTILGTTKVKTKKQEFVCRKRRKKKVRKKTQEKKQVN